MSAATPGAQRCSGGIRPHVPSCAHRDLSHSASSPRTPGSTPGSASRVTPPGARLSPGPHLQRRDNSDDACGVGLESRCGTELSPAGRKSPEEPRSASSDSPPGQPTPLTLSSPRIRPQCARFKRNSLLLRKSHLSAL